MRYNKTMITTQEEAWKPIKDYEKYYEISNLGEVKSLHKNKKRIHTNPNLQII